MFESDYTVDETQKRVEVQFKGSLDAASALDCERRLDILFALQPKHIILDFKGLTYIASQGLRILLSCAKRAQKTGATLALCSLQTFVASVFDMAGFTRIFTIYPSVDAARDAVRQIKS